MEQAFFLFYQSLHMSNLLLLIFFSFKHFLTFYFHLSSFHFLIHWNYLFLFPFYLLTILIYRFIYQGYDLLYYYKKYNLIWLLLFKWNLKCRVNRSFITFINEFSGKNHMLKDISELLLILLSVVFFLELEWDFLKVEEVKSFIKLIMLYIYIYLFNYYR